MVDFRAVNKIFEENQIKQKKLFEDRKVGYIVNWRDKTKKRELEEGEDEETEYFGLNEIKGETYTSEMLNKEEVVKFYKELDKSVIDKESLVICEFYLNDKGERDLTLPYEGFKGYVNIHSLL